MVVSSKLYSKRNHSAYNLFLFVKCYLSDSTLSSANTDHDRLQHDENDLTDHKKNSNDVTETSSDEGVYVEGSESSSPKLPSLDDEFGTIVEREKKSEPLVTREQSEQPQHRFKSRFHFLSSLMLLNSLRAFSRRSFRRKRSNKSNVQKLSPLPSEENDPSRPTSSTSSSTTSSAFSSNSSISSTNLPQQTLDEINMKLIDPESMLPPSGSLITESIIEEEEEEDNCSGVGNKITEQLQQSQSSNLSTITLSSTTQNINDGDEDYQMPRSITSLYPLSLESLKNSCSHNHFSIYGPILCNNCSNHSTRSLLSSSLAQSPLLLSSSLTSTSLSSMTALTAASPTALLLRYCARMYLALPYYDIQIDQKFSVTCRVVLSVSKANESKSPIPIPERLRDKEFNAKGHGDAIRIARNMAAKNIIDKLKAANVFFDE